MFDWIFVGGYTEEEARAGERNVDYAEARAGLPWWKRVLMPKKPHEHVPVEHEDKESSS